MNKILLMVLVITFVSGILLHPFHDAVVILMIHKISSVLLVVGTIVHVKQHRQRKKGKEEEV